MEFNHQKIISYLIFFKILEYIIRFVLLRYLFKTRSLLVKDVYLTCLCSLNARIGCSRQVRMSNNITYSTSKQYSTLVLYCRSGGVLKSTGRTIRQMFNSSIIERQIKLDKASWMIPIYQLQMMLL